jgi:uncharacterized protein involved in exopolysaccharide biosynthesis
MAEWVSGFERTLPEAGWSVRGLGRLALAGWRLVLVCALITTLGGLLALRLLAPEYTATMVVGPIARNGAAAMGTRVPMTLRPDMPSSVLEFGAGDETLSDFTRFLELLTSPPVAARLLARTDLVQRLFADRWDAGARRWQPASGLVGQARRLVLEAAGREDWLEPDPEIVARTLRRMVVVQTVGTNPMRRISVRNPDRALAVRLLAELVHAADDQLRAEAARRAQTGIAYIRSRLNGVTVAEYRQALTGLLADEERLALLLEIDLPFAADPLEPADAAHVPDWPNPLMVLPVALAAGLGLGLALVFARSAWRERGWSGR